MTMAAVSPELLSRFDPQVAGLASGRPAEVRDTFQQFAAGTFYAQMLKSLRQTHGRPAYFHGGQAEEIFQTQMDQYLADVLARQHGSAVSEPLFRVFSVQFEAARRSSAGLSAGRASGKIDSGVKSFPSSPAAASDQ